VGYFVSPRQSVTHTHRKTNPALKKGRRKKENEYAFQRVRRVRGALKTPGCFTGKEREKVREKEKDDDSLRAFLFLFSKHKEKMDLSSTVQKKSHNKTHKHTDTHTLSLSHTNHDEAAAVSRVKEAPERECNEKKRRSDCAASFSSREKRK
jgi:hypothetical protein